MSGRIGKDAERSEEGAAPETLPWVARPLRRALETQQGHALLILGPGGVGQAEPGCQLGPFGAVPDHAGIGAGAGQGQQGIDQQRLAGAGFAGNHGQAVVELQFDRADHGEILEGEVLEHAWRILPETAADSFRRYGIACRSAPALAPGRPWPYL